MSSLLFVLSAICLAVGGALGIAHGLCDTGTCGATPWIVVPLVVAGVVLFLFGFVSVISLRGEDTSRTSSKATPRLAAPPT